MKKIVWPILVILVLAFAFAFYYVRYRPVELVANHGRGDWDQGTIFHVLPTVNHERMLLKVSFDKSYDKPPRLLVDGRKVAGRMTDTQGMFWQFDVAGLKPDTEYQLSLTTAQGKAIGDEWPLKTFPAPDAEPKRLRLLIYTGLGGHDANIAWFGSGPLPLEVRIRLLKRALSFEPDAVVSSGDQIYYDLKYDASSKVMGADPRAINYAGEFDRDKAVLGTVNEKVLQKAVGPQIAYLYGTALRSTPTFFLLDDHDYFENDIATKEEELSNWKLFFLAWRSPFFRGGVSFPPDDFMLELARSAQKLYLPEFLPDNNRPKQGFPATDADDRAQGVSEAYGTLRYGKLFEGLLHEGRRFVTLKGKKAHVIHPRAEEWLIRRMRAEDTRHVAHLSATVFGWSAGKWMEWYPDVRGKDGHLTTAKDKYMWPEGWLLQHNRIMKAATGMDHTVPLFICGDLHSLAAGKLYQSGDLNMGDNPVHIVASGSLGTGRRAWPSAFRGMKAEPSTVLKLKEELKPVEKNGFLIADFTPNKIVLRFFAWRPPEPVAKIDKLKPFYTKVIPVAEAASAH